RVLVMRPHGTDAGMFSADGRHFVDMSGGIARAWDTDGADGPTLVGFHPDSVSSVTFSPDGQRVVTVCNDSAARVWNADGELIAPLQGLAPRGIAAGISTDGGRLFTGSYEDIARVWNADGTGRPALLKGHENGVRGVAFSPDGKRIVTASDDSTARVWNAD